jgi:hypothetical protein
MLRASFMYLRQNETSSMADPSIGSPTVKLIRRTEVRMFARMRCPRG